MLSTTSPSSSSPLTPAQKSQQQWEKKKRTLSAVVSSTNTTRRRRPSDLAFRSPNRLRLYDGALSVAGSARYRDDHSSSDNNQDDGNDGNHDIAVRGAIVTDDEESNILIRHPNNTNTNHHDPSRKMYLSPQMMTAIQTEIMDSLPLPATLASVAMTLLNSTVLWDVNDDDDANNHHNHSKEDEPSNTNNTNNNAAADDDDLSKYFSGITIKDEQQQRQAKKLQFDNLCKGMITKGNHVMLSSWEEVQDGLAEEFKFVRLTTVDDDDEGDGDDGSVIIVEKGGSVADALGGAAAVILETAVVKVASPTTTTPSSKQKQQRRRRNHRFSNNLKSIPKKSHPTSPKPTERRRSIKLQQIAKRIAHTAKRKANMGLDTYKQMMLDKMGKSKYNQLFQQVTITPAKELTLVLDDTAKSLNDKITQLESSRRRTKQDELLAKAELERQARASASKLLRPLTPDEDQIVQTALYGKGYPTEVLASQGADSVQRESIQTLKPGQWLNDEVINYFLKNCLAKRDEKLCAKQPGRKRSHFFNSFFVQAMFDDKNNNTALRGRYNYKNVRRWSKKVPGKDIFNLKYIFCPINLDNMHWTSACIFMEEKKIQYYDSMGGSGMVKLKGLLQYLKDEWKAKKKGGELDVCEWELVACTRDTPQQLNGYDCGVFTCMFADFVTKDCEPVFQQQHITQCRQRIALSIMKNCAIE